MNSRALPVLVLLASVGLGCPAAESPSNGRSDRTTESAAPLEVPRSATDALVAADLMASELYWPNIVALVEPFTPEDRAQPLKRGYRGAMIRLTPEGLVRIDFGRHGRHEVPVAATDLLERANAVRAGDLHKVAPNFLAHFGTQFLDPTTREQAPYPTVELAKSRLFLCLFVSPSDPGFASLFERLTALPGAPRLQMLLFPLGLGLEQIEVVKPALQAAGLLVPFAYPAAAERHAQSLLGRIPAGPHGLLISPEGRVVLEVDLGATALPAALEALRGAIGDGPAGPTPASLAPAITESS